MDAWINFGDMCRNELNLQCQLGYYYFEGLAGYPELGKGLQMKGNKWSYHSAKILKEDAEEFICRVREYRNNPTV